MPRLIPHLISILIVAVTALSGCTTSEQERELNAARSEIRETIQMDWSNNIPIDSLIQADKLCKKYEQLQDCNLVTKQLLDITVSLASCQNDMRSTLCKELVAHFEKSPLAYHMTASKPVALPKTPFYWAMPTTMLDSLAGKYDYRAEATSWWWERWYRLVFSFLAAISITYGALLGWTHWQHRKEIQTERAAERKANLLEQEKLRQTLHERQRAEAKAVTKAESQKLIAEQERVNAEKAERQRLVEQQAVEKTIQDKLAAEQAEAQQLLSAAFSNTKKPKRRKHATSL